MIAARLPSARGLLGLAALGLAAAFALLVGVAVGSKDSSLLVAVGVLIAAIGLFAGCLKPRIFFWILLGTSITLPFLPITETRGTNPVDLLLLPTCIGAWLTRPRSDGALPRVEAVERARRNLERATVAYFGVAVLSLAALALRGFPQYAADSLLIVVRGLQGALFYPLVLLMLRERRDLLHARNAIVVAFLVSAAVNAYGIAALGVFRAGAAWNVTVGEYFISSPNEAGFGIVYLWAILLAFPLRRGPMIAVLLLSLVFLVATTSRSGVLSWFAFMATWAVTGRRAWVLLIPVAMIAIVPFLPEFWSGKFLRTILMQRGSFEIYSSVIRFVAWSTAIKMFLGNPILGVGFVCFRFFSSQFNELTLNLGTAENFLLETAAGMGIIGVAVVAWMAAAIVRLVRAVGRSSWAGSSAGRIAAIAGPFLIAIVVANATADNLIGIMGVTQLSVFCALLVASSRLDSTDGTEAARALGAS